jgi:hypothetical protein
MNADKESISRFFMPNSIYKIPDYPKPQQALVE